jgi:hypothetical protein
MPYNQDRFNEMYRLLTTIYKIPPSHAGEIINKIDDEADARSSADPDIRYNQLLQDASTAGKRWQDADERWGKSVADQSAHANNKENFRLGPISAIADLVTTRPRPDEDEKVAGVRMLKLHLMNEDRLRAEQEKKDQLWVQTWGAQNQPMVDQRGMIMSGTGGNWQPGQPRVDARGMILNPTVSPGVGPAKPPALPLPGIAAGGMIGGK